MIENYSKFDFFDNEEVYIDNKAQTIYVEIIEKGKQFFKEKKHSNIYQDTISALFDKIREYHKHETTGYSIFSRIEVKTVLFERMIDYKVSNYINHSISRQNEYKKYLLDALKLMHTIALFKKSKFKDVFKNVREKYYFLAFLNSTFLQEVYEGLVNEVDYFIGKLSEHGLLIHIDFEDGYISTNGLKYSFLKENQISIDFQYKNPYPRIFKNKTCFDLFVWLKENMVIDTFSDFSYIFYEMTSIGYMYKITQNEFVEFVNEQGSYLNTSKLKMPESNRKRLDKFKDGVKIIKPNTSIF